MIELSVVIPVYNAEKYIKRCIRSIKATSYQNFEIILVNDGSVDNSASICQDISDKESNITYIETENKGAGAARNIGIKHANGTYIGFIDIDDEVSDDYFFSQISLAKKYDADIVMSDVKYIKKKESYFAYLPYEDETLLQRQIICDEYIPRLIAPKCESDIGKNIVRAMWCRIFKKSLIENNQITFTNQINGQDFIFTLACCIKANTIAINKKVYNLYHYEYNESLSKTYTSDRYNRILVSEQTIENLLKEENLFESCKHEFYQMYRHDIYWILRIIVHTSSLSIHYKIKKMKEVIKSSNKNFLIDLNNKELGLQQNILYKLISKEKAFVLLFLIKLKDRHDL